MQPVSATETIFANVDQPNWNERRAANNSFVRSFRIFRWRNRRRVYNRLCGIFWVRVVVSVVFCVYFSAQGRWKKEKRPRRKRVLYGMFFVILLIRRGFTCNIRRRFFLFSIVRFVCHDILLFGTIFVSELNERQIERNWSAVMSLSTVTGTTELLYRISD